MKRLDDCVYTATTPGNPLNNYLDSIRNPATSHTATSSWSPDLLPPPPLPHIRDIISLKPSPSIFHGEHILLAAGYVKLANPIVARLHGFLCDMYREHRSGARAPT